MRDATALLLRLSVAEKNELLFQRGINFNRLAVWQRRGIGLYWEEYEKTGFNPKTGASAKATRRRVHLELELPMKERYDEFLHTRVREASSAAS